MNDPKRKKRVDTDKRDRSVFKRVGYQLIATVSVVVILALASMTLFYSERQRVSILSNNEVAMHKVTETVISGLKTVMLAGYADIAQIYADNLKTVHGVVDFRILRTNGNEAFRDNQTIKAVNAHRGDEDFVLRNTEQTIPVLASDNPQLQSVLTRREILSFYETGEQDEQYLTFLAPILFADKCDKCHDEQDRVRGVLKLTTSLGAVHNDVVATRWDSLKILLVSIVLIITVTILLVRRSVVSPINQVSDAMAAVSGGHLSQGVPIFGQDELAQMATSFNEMTSQLSRTYDDLESEQNKLATIILTASEGIVATNAEGKIVLVNPALGKLLGKSNDTIISRGFDNLLGNPEQMERWLQQSAGQSRTHLVDYGYKKFSVTVACIADHAGTPLGRTAFVRDVTKEKRLEEKLRQLSLTDGLTGLHNRRFLDEAIGRELDRAQCLGKELSVMMLDIDHFKRFNDTHGHEMGDRVLQSVATTLRDSVREVDMACRYGGEEFLAILPSTSPAGACVLAERVRVAVEKLVVEGRLQVTVSIGIAHYTDYPETTAEGLVEAADQALYLAKERGRNRVEVAVRSETGQSAADNQDERRHV